MKSKIRAMISDNSSEVFGVYAKQLADFDIELLPSPRDGVRLLDEIAAQKPQVVIVDAFLPGIDCVGILSALSKIEKEQAPDVIAMSGFDSRKLEDGLRKAGAADYFIKPLDSRRLAVRITELVESRASRYADAAYASDFNPDTIMKPDTEPVETLELTVTDILRSVGIPAHIRGYYYLRSAIIMTTVDPLMINAVTKVLYPAIAEEFDALPSCVERAIRHAINVSWNNASPDVISNYFGRTFSAKNGRPTNSEFIAMISDKLRITAGAAVSRALSRQYPSRSTR